MGVDIELPVYRRFDNVFVEFTLKEEEVDDDVVDIADRLLLLRIADGDDNDDPVAVAKRLSP